jgi:hypothetical protein
MPHSAVTAVAAGNFQFFRPLAAAAGNLQFFRALAAAAGNFQFFRPLAAAAEIFINYLMQQRRLSRSAYTSTSTLILVTNRLRNQLT